jgi:hypothetical protein
MGRPDPAARWRGAASALLTVALAVGAHALAAGTPSGAGVALVVVLAATLGAICATAPAPGARGSIALLSAGQVLGHLVLAAAGHGHTGHQPFMFGAHAAAVVGGAVLIAAGDRLCRALSTVVRPLTVSTPRPPQTVVIAAKTADQPPQWMLLLLASVPHRGPPVGLPS